jgi:hypothetical protein
MTIKNIVAARKERKFQDKLTQLRLEQRFADQRRFVEVADRISREGKTW